jgi:manganese transport protein
VMYLDALVAMLIYTAVTAAFYLLGAAILYKRGEIPAGNELIETVALIYTESLGKGVRTMYLIGAFFVLFSSLFATLAAWTRIYPDIFGQVGWIDFTAKRKKVVALLAWIIPVGWALSYLFINLPLAMILFGGAVGSVMLFLVVFAVLHVKYGRPQYFKPNLLYDIVFWISVVSILAVGVYGVSQLV